MSRTFLITGAASGLGRHLVGRFSKERVWATDVEPLPDEWGPEVGRSRLDVADSDSWEEALDAVEARFGPVDVLIHCAAVIQPRWALDLTDAEIDRQLSINLGGTIRGIRSVGRRMVDRGEGHLVLINSLTGLAPSPGMSVYAASKFGARGFALSAAQELGRKGVAVSLVYPDGMATPMGAFESHFPEAALTFSGRLLSTEEVARAIDDVLRTRVLRTDRSPPPGLALQGRGAHTLGRSPDHTDSRTTRTPSTTAIPRRHGLVSLQIP